MVFFETLYFSASFLAVLIKTPFWGFDESCADKDHYPLDFFFLHRNVNRENTLAEKAILLFFLL